MLSPASGVEDFAVSVAVASAPTPASKDYKASLVPPHHQYQEDGCEFYYIFGNNRLPLSVKQWKQTELLNIKYIFITIP